MEQLKNLDFTENDFQLLIDGLDALPEKGTLSVIMAELVKVPILTSESQAKEAAARVKKAFDRLDVEKKLMMEDIRILQGKLYLMKRFLVENNLLKKASDIVNNKT